MRACLRACVCACVCVCEITVRFGRPSRRVAWSRGGKRLGEAAPAGEEWRKRWEAEGPPHAGWAGWDRGGRGQRWDASITKSSHPFPSPLCFYFGTGSPLESTVSISGRLLPCAPPHASIPISARPVTPHASISRHPTSRPRRDAPIIRHPSPAPSAVHLFRAAPDRASACAGPRRAAL
jgi:hypothetical protein